LRLSGASITPGGKVTGPPGEQIRRSLVIGDVLWTISDTTMSVYSMDRLVKLADVPLAP
ncbi:MAG: hypothetical protein V7603_816, partial [Micromonosporaceae bacterium]